MLQRQKRLISVARKTQSDLNKCHLRERQEDSPTTFRVNDYVLVQYPDGVKGKPQPPTKNHTNLKGPMKVVSFIGVQYELLNLASM